MGAWSPWGYFRRLQQQLDQLLYTEISDCRANYDPDRTDILTLLLSAVEGEKSKPNPRSPFSAKLYFSWYCILGKIPVIKSSGTKR